MNYNQGFLQMNNKVKELQAGEENRKDCVNAKTSICSNQNKKDWICETNMQESKARSVILQHVLITEYKN